MLKLLLIIFGARNGFAVRGALLRFAMTVPSRPRAAHSGIALAKIDYKSNAHPGILRSKMSGISLLKAQSARFCLLFALCTASTAFAATSSEQLQNLLGNLTTYQANFEQTIFSPEGGAMQHAKGSMALQRPGKFRWNVTSPNRQLIIADGKQIWIYTPDLQQAILQPMQKNLANSPAFLLTGSTQELAKTFNISSMKSPRPGQWFKLTPKQNNGLFQWVALGFKDGVLYQMDLKDSLDQQTEVVFSKAKMNQSLQESLFQFSPPKGVDVIKQMA